MAHRSSASLRARLSEFNSRSKGARRKNSVYAFIPSGDNPPFEPSWLRSSPRAAFTELCRRVGSEAEATNTVNSGQHLLAEFHLYVDRNTNHT